MLAQLFEVLRGAVVAMNDRTTDYERGAVAARWLEFEIAPLLESIDLDNELARVEIVAVAAFQESIGKPQRHMLPIDSGIAILPGNQAQVVARPQSSAFRAERILISPAIAPYFRINNIRVGNRSQFMQSGGVDAMVFASDRSPPDDLRIQFETCQTAMDFVFDITYTGADPNGMQFRALVLGITEDSRPMRTAPPRAPRTGPMPIADAQTLIAAWQEIMAKPAKEQAVGRAQNAANAGDDLDIEIDESQGWNNGNFG